MISILDAAAKLSFGALCRMLSTVQRESKGESKLSLLFSDALRQELGESGNMYSLLRLVLPQLDRERTYNLKEKKIARIYIDVLGMGPQTSDARKLENFNDPTIVDSKAVGDFPAVLLEVLQYRSLVAAEKTTHTVGDVNTLLDNLCLAETNEARKKIFMTIATTYPAIQQQWIIRIILKDLKVGLRHERVLGYLHPDAMEMYNHTNDLNKVCSELKDSSIRYVPEITPFQIFSPMLAKRVEFGDCTREINADIFAMEPKLDGERITCHVQDNEVQFISRNGINYTDIYGPHVSPNILSQLAPNLDIILDGEMMVWDDIEHRFREFGMLKNVANSMRSNETPHRWLCYVVWDVVYLGGTARDKFLEEAVQKVQNDHGILALSSGKDVLKHAVMGLPLRVRRTLLEMILSVKPTKVEIIDQTVVNDPSPKARHDQVMAEIDRQVASGGEGIILKDLSSHYMCGETSRKTKKWIKLKPDYAGMTTNLDVLIIGGYYGTGRRRSGAVSVFLVGVLSRSLANQEIQDYMKPGSDAPIVYSFAKVGTGYNFEELENLRQELAPHWQPWIHNSPPSHMIGWMPQRSDLRPDVWIDPRQSKVMEVFGFELTYTTLYQTGLTIRFPRCKAFRHDKSWHEAMSVQDLNTIRGSAFNKRAAAVAYGEKNANKRMKQKKLKSSAMRANSGGVMEQFTLAKLDKVEMKQNIFHGIEFCVLPGQYQDDRTKQDVEVLLHSHGGQVVQNPIANSTNYVIAPTDTGLKVSNLKTQGKFDIIRDSWILDSINSNRFLPLRARNFIFSTESTKILLAKEYDRYGDHYVEHVQPDELKKIFSEMSNSGIRNATSNSGARWQELRKEMLCEEAEVMDSSATFLSHCTVVFDNETINFTDLSIYPQRVRMFAGTVQKEIDENVTHVIVNSTLKEKLNHLRPVIQAIRRNHPKEPTVVTLEWLQSCLKEQMQLPSQEYIIPI